FVAPPALGLLLRSRDRASAAAVGAPAFAGLALLPLAVPRHSKGTGWVHLIPLGRRVPQIPAQFVLGMGTVRFQTGAVIALAVVGVLVWLAWRPGEPTLRRALTPATTGLAALALPAALALAGYDYLVSRYVIFALIPLLVAAAVLLGGSPRRRLGAVVAVGLCLLGVASSVAEQTTPELERAN